jgi:hypothetical protein
VRTLVAESPAPFISVSWIRGFRGDVFWSVTAEKFTDDPLDGLVMTMSPHDHE